MRCTQDRENPKTEVPKGEEHEDEADHADGM